MRLLVPAILIAACLALTACEKGPTKDPDRLTRLDSNLIRAIAATDCKTLLPDESIVVLPQVDCNGCNSLTQQILGSGKIDCRILTASINHRRVERYIGPGMPACYTPFGLEDYGLKEVLTPSLFYRKKGRIEEVVVLNGPGIQRLEELGLKKPE